MGRRHHVRWTAEGWLYLAVVLDLYSRRVVAWGMSSRPIQEQPTEALTMAVAHRRRTARVLHHTDRGSQYAAMAYREHESARQLLGQCRRRKFLPYVKNGARLSSARHDPGRHRAGYF